MTAYEYARCAYCGRILTRELDHRSKYHFCGRKCMGEHYRAEAAEQQFYEDMPERLEMARRIKAGAWRLFGHLPSVNGEQPDEVSREFLRRMPR